MIFDYVDYGINTRSRIRRDLSIDRANTNWKMFDIRYRGVVLYNSLPERMKNEQRISVFKTLLHDYIKNKFMSNLQVN